MYCISLPVGVFYILQTWRNSVTAERPTEKAMSTSLQKETHLHRQVSDPGAFSSGSESQGVKHSLLEVQERSGAGQLRGVLLSGMGHHYMVSGSPKDWICDKGPSGKAPMQPHAPVGLEDETCHIKLKFQLLATPPEDEAAGPFAGHESREFDFVGRWAIAMPFFEGKQISDPFKNGVTTFTRKQKYTEDWAWLKQTHMPWAHMMMTFDSDGAHIVAAWTHETSGGGKGAWWEQAYGKHVAFRLYNAPPDLNPMQMFQGMFFDQHENGMTWGISVNTRKWKKSEEGLEGTYDFRVLNLPPAALARMFLFEANKGEVFMTGKREDSGSQVLFKMKGEKDSCNEFADNCPFFGKSTIDFEFSDEMLRMTNYISNGQAKEYILLWPIWRHPSEISEFCKKNAGLKEKTQLSPSRAGMEGKFGTAWEGATEKGQL